MSTEIGFGAWGLGGDSYGAITEVEALNLLELAYEMGIRVFDTSPSYGDGQSEFLLGKFFKRHRDVQIFTKVGMLPHNTFEIPHDFTTKNLYSSVDESLRRLNSEQLALIQLHSPQLDYLIEYPSLLEDLDRLVVAGKVGKVGISLRSPNYLVNQLDDYPWASFQFNFSLLDQRILDSDSVGSRRFLDAIRIARTPLHFGFLTDLGVNLKALTSDQHLTKWPVEQLRIWEAAASDFREIAVLAGVSLETLAFQYLKATKIPTIIIPGIMTPDQLQKNCMQYSMPEIGRDFIEMVKETYIKIQTSLKVNTPFTYVNKGK